MKKLLYTLLMGLFAVSAMAQNAHAAKGQDKQKNHKPLVEMELTYMDSMQIMDAETFAKFAPIYREYAAERSAIRQQIRAAKKAMRAEGVTEQQAQDELKKMLDGEVRLAELTRTYSEKFLTVLTPQQVVQVYKVHDTLRTKILQARREKRQHAAKK